MHDIEYIDEIESTNAYARNGLAKLPNFKVISANNQKNGHGQFERRWLSSAENGGNCYISIVLKPENIEHLGELTQFTSLMVAKTLKTYGLKPRFKYPNDVLIEDKKIAGILAESVFMGNNLKGVVVGIGVNLNLSLKELNKIDIKATSIYNETGYCVEKIEFINKLLNIFKENYEDFLKNGNKGDILKCTEI